MNIGDPNDTSELTSISNGDIVFWIEQGTSIHIRARTPEGDPVELSEEEAKELAHGLLRLVKLLE